MSRRFVFSVVFSAIASFILVPCDSPAIGQEKGKMQRLVRFQAGDAVSYGLVAGDRVLTVRGENPFGALETTPGKEIRLADVKLLVPCPRPTQILALAGNYKSHLGAGDQITTVTTTTKITTSPSGQSTSETKATVETEKPGEVPVKFQTPQFFFKSPSCLVGTGENIEIPPGTNDVHYEAELVIVIGRKVKNASAEEARQAIFGVTCGNDVSARDWQKADVQWWRAKGCNTFGPIGPAIVSGIDYDNLTVRLRLNGKVMQEESTSQFIHNVTDTVRFASQHVTLHPGDLIFTGTPGKTSAIKPGDKVEVEIEGVGTLVNTVVAAKE